MSLEDSMSAQGKMTGETETRRRGAVWIAKLAAVLGRFVLHYPLAPATIRTNWVGNDSRNRDVKLENSKMNRAEMIKVDGEIVVVSCEHCGHRHGILSDQFSPETLSFCSCGICLRPLFSSEELYAPVAIDQPLRITEADYGKHHGCR
jgi:hypothetical protein